MRVLLIALSGNLLGQGIPSLGVYRIQYFLNRNGIACDVLEYGNDDPQEVFTRLRAGEYAIVGIHGTYVFLEQELKIAALIRKEAAGSNPLLIAGGQSPSLVPEYWLSLGFDAVVKGYGEFATLSLARVGIAAGGDWDNARLEKVPGLVYTRQGVLFENKPQPVTAEDFYLLFYTLPREAGILESWRKYTGQSTKTADPNPDGTWNKVFLYTSHKCPGACGFCSTRSFLKESYEGQPHLMSLKPEDTAALIQHFYERFGIKEFFILDDNFLFPKEQLWRFCEVMQSMRRKGVLPRDLTLRCQGRVVDLLDKPYGEPDDKLIQELYSIGVRQLALGIENFSARLLGTAILNKKAYTGQIAMNLLRTLTNTGILCIANLMLLVPESTKEEFLFNLDRVIDVFTLGGTPYMAGPILPFPGATAFSASRYPAVTSKMVSPLNGMPYEKKMFFIPHDATLRKAWAAFTTGGAKDEERKKIIRRYGTNVHVGDPSVDSLVTVLTYAKLLRADALAQRAEKEIAGLAATAVVQ